MTQQSTRGSSQDREAVRWGYGEQGLGLERLRREVLEVGGKPGGDRRALYLTAQPFRLMSREAPVSMEQ